MLVDNDAPTAINFQTSIRSFGMPMLTGKGDKIAINQDTSTYMIEMIIRWIIA